MPPSVGVVRCTGVGGSVRVGTATCRSAGVKRSAPKWLCAKTLHSNSRDLYRAKTTFNNLIVDDDAELASRSLLLVQQLTNGGIFVDDAVFHKSLSNLRQLSESKHQ